MSCSNNNNKVTLSHTNRVVSQSNPSSLNISGVLLLSWNCLLKAERKPIFFFHFLLNLGCTEKQKQDCCMCMCTLPLVKCTRPLRLHPPLTLCTVNPPSPTTTHPPISPPYRLALPSSTPSVENPPPKTQPSQLRSRTGINQKTHSPYSQVWEKPVHKYLNALCLVCFFFREIVQVKLSPLTVSRTTNKEWLQTFLYSHNSVTLNKALG